MARTRQVNADSVHLQALAGLLVTLLTMTACQPRIDCDRVPRTMAAVSLPRSCSPPEATAEHHRQPTMHESPAQRHHCCCCFLAHTMPAEQPTNPVTTSCMVSRSSLSVHEQDVDAHDLAYQYVLQRPSGQHNHPVKKWPAWTVLLPER